jgi:hypothetical protein
VDELGEECNMHGGDENSFVNVKERDNFEDQGVDGMTVMWLILKK